MPDSPTPRMGLEAVAGGDLLNTIDTTTQGMVDDIDQLSAIFSQGTFDSRPTSTPGTPGIQGRFYYATDRALLYYDHGTGWETIMPGSQADELGASIDGVVRRGKSIIATEESRSNAAYGTLTTPDQVADVVLPTDGLIVVAYQAMWKESVDGSASAAIFVGSNQLKAASDSASAPSALFAEAGKNPGAVGAYRPLSTHARGLTGATGAVAAYTGDVTTGQAVGQFPTGAGSADYGGGPCYIFAAAGTYTISVQFKASSGSVTAKERKLWVEARGY